MSHAPIAINLTWFADFSYRVPVCTLDSQPKKLFDVQWAASGLIVAGGEAGTLHALTVPGTGGMGQAGDE
eukprot:m.34490 g.34490  ORF g.34490 m.34490 type:complete len:70 (+) comp9770_c0_seq1:1350-1559(+)